MVIERFKTPGAIEVYRRARDQGRLMPKGWSMFRVGLAPGDRLTFPGGRESFNPVSCFILRSLHASLSLPGTAVAGELIR